ncbi:uncharacterized protein LOC111022541 [Momordica charantia]|uniref:Uncharacterized protein LOC111022541 n=1 Tax=Momordica charantia TaxID=3673 RepID=A0A6J1DMU9_MOMCH|nr:uncharacterized protein LOC111022541 [Momordica charantia]
MLKWESFPFICMDGRPGRTTVETEGMHRVVRSPNGGVCAPDNQWVVPPFAGLLPTVCGCSGSLSYSKDDDTLVCLRRGEREDPTKREKIREEPREGMNQKGGQCSATQASSPDRLVIDVDQGSSSRPSWRGAVLGPLAENSRRPDLTTMHAGPSPSRPNF